MNEVVSIIVPVYNSEKYIFSCLESICNQSYSELEIIVVNDGSEDNSELIIKEFTARDSRIRLFSQENSGVSCARNFGISKATGKWIMFVDSDDELKSDYCEKMVIGMKESSAEALISCGNSAKDGEIMKISTGQLESLTESAFAFDEKFCFNIDAPWGKIFDSNLVKSNRIQFPEKLTRSEDAFFCIRVYQKAKTVALIGGNGYIHHQRNGSITQSFDSGYQETLEKVLLESKSLLNDIESSEKYFNACSFRVLPGISEAERTYFLNEKNPLSVWKIASEYSKFIESPIIHSCLNSIGRSDIIGTPYRFRLLVYRLHLSRPFMLIKLKLKQLK